MLFIIAIVLVVCGLAIPLGKITVSEERTTRLFMGFGLLNVAAVLIVLMVRFPHG